MIIVDAFSHLGECRVLDQNVSETALLDALNNNQVSAAVVAPFPAPANPAKIHDQIAALATQHPGRIFGLANVNPHINRDLYHKEVERAVRQLGFVGLVMSTLGHAVNPNGEDAKTVFEAARDLAVPLVIETGSVPFGLPSALFRRVRDYSDVKILLGHSGQGLFTAEAEQLAREFPNVFLETSGCPGPEIKRLVEGLGPNRVLMGSDVPENLASELAKYRNIGLYHYQLYQTLGQSAIDLFALKGVTELPEPAATA